MATSYWFKYIVVKLLILPICVFCRQIFWTDAAYNAVLQNIKHPTVHLSFMNDLVQFICKIFEYVTCILWLKYSKTAGMTYVN